MAGFSTYYLPWRARMEIFFAWLDDFLFHLTALTSTFILIQFKMCLFNTLSGNLARLQISNFNKSNKIEQCIMKNINCNPCLTSYVVLLYPWPRIEGKRKYRKIAYNKIKWLMIQSRGWEREMVAVFSAWQVLCHKILTCYGKPTQQVPYLFLCKWKNSGSNNLRLIKI